MNTFVAGHVNPKMNGITALKFKPLPADIVSFIGKILINHVPQ
jgi:hypothetical protein